MNSRSPSSSDPSRQRHAQSGDRRMFHVEHIPKSEDIPDTYSTSADWRAPLAALEQRHADRLAQLEERLAAVERAAADLGGQVQNLR